MKTGDTLGAIELIKDSADNGDADAAYFMSKLYLEGEVVTRDANVGTQYLHKAADLCSVEAMIEIGSAGYEYEGSDEDLAYLWRLKAQLDNYDEDTVFNILGIKEEDEK